LRPLGKHWSIASWRGACGDFDEPGGSVPCVFRADDRHSQQVSNRLALDNGVYRDDVVAARQGTNFELGPQSSEVGANTRTNLVDIADNPRHPPTLPR
jgi:hypothetical protein